MVERAEVWWYDHPEAGRRPYLILTRTEAVPVLNQLLGVPATTTVRGIPTEVPLDESDGMPLPCVLSLDNVGAVRKSLLTTRIARLGPDKMASVCAALRIASGC